MLGDINTDCANMERRRKQWADHARFSDGAYAVCILALFVVLFVAAALHGFEDQECRLAVERMNAEPAAESFGVQR